MGDNSRKPSADQADKSKEAQKPKDTSKSTDVPKNKGGVDRSKRPTTQPGRPAVGKPNSDNGSGKTKGSGADSGSKALGEAKNSHLDRCHATPRLSGDGRQRPPDRGDRIWNPFEQPGDRAKQGDGVRYVPVVERIDIGSFRDPIIRPDGFVPQREPDPEAGYNFDTYIQVAGNKGRLIPAKHIGGTRYQVLMGTPCQPGCHLGRGKEIDLRGKHPVMAVLEAFQTARSFAGPGMRAGGPAGPKVAPKASPKPATAPKPAPTAAKPIPSKAKADSAPTSGPKKMPATQPSAKSEKSAVKGDKTKAEKAALKAESAASKGRLPLDAEGFEKALKAKPGLLNDAAKRIAARFPNKRMAVGVSAGVVDSKLKYVATLSDPAAWKALKDGKVTLPKGVELGPEPTMAKVEFVDGTVGKRPNLDPFLHVEVAGPLDLQGRGAQRVFVGTNFRACDGCTQIWRQGAPNVIHTNPRAE